MRGLLQLLDAIPRSSGPKAVRRVLDLGCGIGRVLVRLSMAGYGTKVIDGPDSPDSNRPEVGIG